MGNFLWRPRLVNPMSAVNNIGGCIYQVVVHAGPTWKCK